MRRTLIALAIAGAHLPTAAFASALGFGDVRAVAMGGMPGLVSPGRRIR